MNACALHFLAEDHENNIYKPQCMPYIKEQRFTDTSSWLNDIFLYHCYIHCYKHAQLQTNINISTQTHTHTVPNYIMHI